MFLEQQVPGQTTAFAERADLLRSLELELNAQDYLWRWRPGLRLELAHRWGTSGATNDHADTAARFSSPDQIACPSAGYCLDSEPLTLTTADTRLGRLLHGLVAAFQPVHGALVGVWLHGSLATGDYTPYSDVDALVILRYRVLGDAQALRRVRAAVVAALRWILWFDPLQHHGFFIGVEGIMCAWPANYLPAAALQHARPLWRPAGTVSLCEHEDIRSARSTFDALARQVFSAGHPRTLYHAKSLLSQFMLLPAAFCQARGQTVYKRESFPIVKREFAEHWRAMEEATLMRAEWRTPRRPLWPWLLRISNPWMASRLYRRMEIQLPKCQLYPSWAKFIDGMQQLASAMMQRIY